MCWYKSLSRGAEGLSFGPSLDTFIDYQAKAFGDSPQIHRRPLPVKCNAQEVVPQFLIGIGDGMELLQNAVARDTPI